MAETYKVVYQREADGLWFASIPTIPGCYSQGWSIAQARDRIREALSVFAKHAATACFEEEVG